MEKRFKQSEKGRAAQKRSTSPSGTAKKRYNPSERAAPLRSVPRSRCRSGSRSATAPGRLDERAPARDDHEAQGRG